MVEILTPTAGVQARQAGQVSTAPQASLARAAGAMQTAANTFTEFYEKEAAIQNDLLLATTQNDWTKRYEESKGNAGAGYAEGLVGEYDQYVTKVLESAPKRGRDQLELALQKYRMNLEAKALQREAAARAAAKAAAIAESNRLRANALLTDPSLLPEYLEGATAAQRSLFIKSAMSGELLIDPQAVSDAVTSGQWDADLSPSEKLSFMKSSAAGVETRQREEEAIAASNQRALEIAAENELLYAQVNGGALPADTELSDENIEAVAGDNAEWAANMKFARDQALMDAGNIYNVTRATPEELNAQYQQYQSDIIDDPARTEQDLARMASFQNALAAREEAIKSDAAGYVANNSEVLQDSWRLYAEADPEVKAEAAGQYAGIVMDEQIRIGVPPQFRTILPKAAAMQQVEAFNNMGADIAPQALRDFVNEWRGNAPQAIAELEKAGLAPEYVEAMRNADNPALSSRIANLVGVSETDLKENLGIKASDAEKLITESMSTYYEAFVAGDETGQAVSIMNDRLTIARKLVWKDVLSGMDYAKAVEKELGDLFPENVLQGDSVNMVLPVGVPPKQFEAALENYMKPETMGLRGVAPLDDPRLPEFADKAVLYEALQKNGVWLNDSSGTGATLTLNINGAYLPMMLEDGSYYTIPFDIGFASSGTSFFKNLVPPVQ